MNAPAGHEQTPGSRSAGPPDRPRPAFGREARLRTRQQLDWVRRHGVKRVGRRCVIVVALDPPDGGLRTAFLISRRFSRKAVVRNRARRLFREVFRRLAPALPSMWLLFIPRAHLIGAGLSDLERDVTRLLGDLLRKGADGLDREHGT
jgi:ribonuclease P protein component